MLWDFLLKEMMIDMSIIDIGGCKNTRVKDILLSQFNPEFQELFDVTSDCVFLDGANNIVVEVGQQLDNEFLFTVDAEQLVQDSCNSQQSTSLAVFGNESSFNPSLSKYFN